MASPSKAVYQLDSIDRRMIEFMRLEPQISQSELSRRLGISQPSVAVRIRRLKDAGILIFRAGLNLRKLGLLVGSATVSAEDPHRVISRFKGCPNLLCASSISGQQNVLLIFVGEDMASLQGIIDQHVRREPGVRDVDFRLLGKGLGDYAFCPSFCFDRRNVSPCGSRCSLCVHYTDGDCVGCPASFDYRGSFWNFTRRRSRQCS